MLHIQGARLPVMADDSKSSFLQFQIHALRERLLEERLTRIQMKAAMEAEKKQAEMQRALKDAKAEADQRLLEERMEKKLFEERTERKVEEARAEARMQAMKTEAQLRPRPNLPSA